MSCAGSASARPPVQQSRRWAPWSRAAPSSTPLLLCRYGTVFAVRRFRREWKQLIA